MARGLVQRAVDHPRLAPAFVVALSLGALGTAWAAEVWGGLAPCVLCLYQRYAYGAALVFGLAGLGLGRWPAARRLALVGAGLAFLGGAAIAGFHVGVEQHWWRGTPGCHAPTLDPETSIEELRRQMLETRFVPCDEVPWSLFGISMAGYNFLASLALAAASLWAARRIARGRAR